MPREAFERSLDLLEKNKLVEYSAFALLGAGPIAFIAFLTHLFPPGLFGMHVTLFGLFLWLASKRANLRAKRRRAAVRADHTGISIDGKLVVPRADIVDGFFQPRPGRDPNKASSHGSSVRILGKHRRILFEAEAEESECLEMLHVLGLDPGSKRAEFLGSSPIFATQAMSMFFMFCVMVAAVALEIVFTDGGRLRGPLIPIFIFPLILAAMLPSKIAVGLDGVLVRWLWTKRFTPMSKILSVERVEDRTIRLRLADYSEQLVHTSMRRKYGWASNYVAQHRDAVLARIGEARTAFLARGPAADVSALVGRGQRTRSEWLSALGKLREREGGGYRDTVLREEDLWRVVEDPSAPEDARGGAAMLLRSKLDDAGKARVRVAAEATASPKLRVALDAAASAEEEAVAFAALEDLAGDDVATHARTVK